ncbi:MAG: carotenoid biosynthesis protein, partial [Planctomycetota bacterium]
DPVALRGERWFLGRIYHYPGGGVHHGVPLSNYGGWWLVGATILGLFAWIDRRLPAEPQRAGAGLGALFYLSIMAFCVGVAGWIGAWEVAVSGGLIASPIAALALGRALLGQPRRG